jgi:hypothetical protein
VKLGVWNTVELKLAVVTGSAAGYMSAYITEQGQEPSETATVTKTGIQNAAITDGVLGIQDFNNTTNCTILMDGFQYSGATASTGTRIYPTKNRFSPERHFLRSGTFVSDQGFHAFVGAGTVSNVSALAGASDDTLVSIYDTDTAQAHIGNRKAVLSSSAGIEVLDVAGVPFDVIRGCYVEAVSASKDNVEVVVSVSRAPNWFSEGNMKRYASRRNLTG